MHYALREETEGKFISECLHRINFKKEKKTNHLHDALPILIDCCEIATMHRTNYTFIWMPMVVFNNEKLLSESNDVEQIFLTIA